MSDEHLDRAILKGMMAVGGHPSNDEQRRTYARALIAELLRGMEDAEEELYLTWMDGFKDALAEIRRRAGIVEGEG